MGRDGVLPKRFFAYIVPRFHTPVLNLALMGAVGFLALFSTVANATSFINFGALTGFAFVNISVIVFYFRFRGSRAMNPLGWILAPLIGLGVCLWLMSSLDWKALTLGGVWLVIGIVYLTYLTSGFKVAPPEMDFSEEEELMAPDEAAPTTA